MSDRAVRTTLELTLNPEYVRDWDNWEAIRELLQNALDADDKGYPISISYITNTKSPQLIAILFYLAKLAKLMMKINVANLAKE